MHAHAGPRVKPLSRLFDGSTPRRVAFTRMEEPRKTAQTASSNGASADGRISAPNAHTDGDGAGELDQAHHHRPGVREIYHRHCTDPRRERAFLSATGFTVAFGACRLVTHAIRAQVGPFRNMSVGGRHLHHSTFGIFGLIGIGQVWTYRMAIGGDTGSRTGSRATATAYGVFTALTLDEFALWFDLQDDYWNAAGRKSIDAVAIFGGLSTMGLAGRGLLIELAHAGRLALRDLRRA